MARRASLEPRKTRKRQLPFVVNFPPLLSSTGKRERRYFDTQAAAKALCKQQKSGWRIMELLRLRFRQVRLKKQQPRSKN
jgi:hypothetical protein